MTDNLSKLYLILPAYNEEKNIARVLSDYTHFFLHPECRFHVVINNSTDKTNQIAWALAKEDSRILVTTIPESIGKGGAVKQGFDSSVTSSADYIGFSDSDGAVAASECAKLVQKLNHQPSLGLVIGSRWMTGAAITKRQSLSRQLLSRLFNFVIRSLFHLPYHDTQCGLKLFRRDALAKIAPYLQETSFAFDVELLWLSQRFAIQTREVPIVWHNSAQSSVRPLQISWSLVTALWRIRFSTP